MSPPHWELFTYRAKLSDKPRRTGDDGDTVLLIWDQGRGTHGEEAVRLAGVWSPEHQTQGGTETATFLRLALADTTRRALTAGRRWPFILVTQPSTAVEPDERRTFTRYVGTLYVADTGVCINDLVNGFLATHPEWGGGIGTVAEQ